jgi:hypothetical protein
MTTWSEWFISKVRADLTERITNLEEIWDIMIFSPERQSVAEAAARVAENIINELEEEIARQREIIDDLKLKIPISDNI